MSPSKHHSRNSSRSRKNFILQSRKKKTQKGSGLSEQLLRAMNMLSGRSQNTIQTNLTLLKNKNDKRNLANALRTTRKIRR